MSGFPPFSFTEIVRGLHEFEEIEISSKAAEVTVNNREDSSEDFCLGFDQKFGLWCALYFPHPSSLS